MNATTSLEFDQLFDAIHDLHSSVLISCVVSNDYDAALKALMELHETMDKLTNLYISENYPAGTEPRYSRAIIKRDKAMKAFGRMH